jgi:predicted dehydrogenase
MNKIRLGIIGCGIAARELHLPALKKLQNQFSITCVCNHTEPKARDFAKLAGGVPYVLDYRELLDRDDIEAVDIVLPIHLNYAVTHDALRAGKHVIVEKPLAANLIDGRKMLQFPGRFRKVMMVAENFRYRPVFHRVRDHLRKGTIGRPYAVIWNVFHQLTTENRYVRTQWRIRHKYPGGFITDGGVHNIAALRFLFGDITSGRAFTKNVNPGIGKIDTMSFQFAARAGVNGVLNIFCSAIGYNEHKLVILGNKATMVITENIITFKRKNKPDTQEVVEDDGGFEAEFMDFYSAIRKHHKVTSTFKQGYRDLEVIIRALTSAE